MSFKARRTNLVSDKVCMFCGASSIRNTVYYICQSCGLTFRPTNHNVCVCGTDTASCQGIWGRPDWWHPTCSHQLCAFEVKSGSLSCFLSACFVDSRCQHCGLAASLCVLRYTCCHIWVHESLQWHFFYTLLLLLLQQLVPCMCSWVWAALLMLVC